MGPTLGIDLGTSYSCAAAVRDDAVVIVEDEQGRRTMPSVVRYDPQGRPVVGYEALLGLVGEPSVTIHSAKRMLGFRFGDPPVRIAQSAYLYKVVEGPNRWPLIEAPGGPYAVPAVLGSVLGELRFRAERFFGETVKRAVITVPANATDAQREQTKVAGRIAGLEVLGLLNEPTAAAMAYALLRIGGRTMAVYDFGGGTFDCTVMQWEERFATVLATLGDSFLGGDDIDLAMAVHVAQEFQRRTGVDIRRRAADWRQLLLACEAGKRTLSRQDATTIRVRGVARLQGAGGPVDLEHEMGRDQLARLASPFVSRTVEIVREALVMAGMEAAQLDQVLMVGGSSRLPQARAAVQDALGGGKVPLVDIDPETAVCIGAAAFAHRMTGGRSRSIERAHGRVTEVVPRSFGLATATGGFDCIIPRNTPLPARGTRTYTTFRDGQQEMRFVVLQGDSARASENAHVGEFVVGTLPGGPAGEVSIELVLEVATDGMLRVSATNPATGQVHQLGVRVADRGPGDRG
jgi:molecular chaperone DnaK